MNTQSANQRDAPLAYTLEPLRSDGPHALDPEPTDGITKVTLREIQLSWDDALHKTTVAKSDDLFACEAAEDGASDLLPPGPELTQAVLDFEFTGSARPYTVRISPPSTLACTPKAGTQRITTFLSKHRFLAPVHTALILLITALAAIAAPWADIDDDDDDEKQEPRHQATSLAPR